MSSKLSGGMGLIQTAITDSVAQLVENLSANFAKIDKIYPVGAIYMSTASTNPSSFLGGTWEQIEGRFLVGIDDDEFATPGGRGGQFDMGIVANGDDTDATAKQNYGLAESNTYAGRVLVKRAGYTGKVLPPYYAVYIFHRTA